MDLFGDEPIEEEIDDDISEATEITASEEIFTVPRAMNFISGHEAIEKNLLDLYNSGKMPHGFVFAGPKGIGKSTMAFRFARFLLKNGIKDPNQSSMFGDDPSATSLDVKPEETTFRLVASGGHPDFFSAERKYDEAKGIYKDILDVEEIRKIAPFLRMTSSEGGWRVVIVNDADTMNTHSQNAILKILEEPPKNSVLMLVTHRAGALIPTIRSRVRFINFMPLQDDVMKNLLEKAKPELSSREIGTLIKLSEGSFGKAIQYVDNQSTEVLAMILRLLEGKQSINWLEIHKLADSFSNSANDQGYETFQEILNWIARQLTYARARGTTPPAELQNLLKNSSLEELLKICENLENHFLRSDISNLDRRQTVLGAFSLLAA